MINQGKYGKSTQKTNSPIRKTPGVACRTKQTPANLKANPSSGASKNCTTTTTSTGEKSNYRGTRSRKQEREKPSNTKTCKVEEDGEDTKVGPELTESSKKLVMALQVFMKWYSDGVYSGNIKKLSNWNCVSKAMSAYVFRYVLTLPWPQAYYPLYSFEELFKTVPVLRSAFQGYLNFQFMLLDADLKYLTKQAALDLSRQREITGSGLQKLDGIKKLDLSMCIQLNDEDLELLPTNALETLAIHACGQFNLTDKAFRRWTHLRNLNMRWCDQKTISNDAFSHLSSLTHLNLSGCSQTSITDEAFTHLSNLVSLDISECMQFTNAAFTHLRRLEKLIMNGCNQSFITDECFQHLGSLRYLDMQNCDQEGITCETVENLPQLEVLKKGPGLPLWYACFLEA